MTARITSSMVQRNILADLNRSTERLANTQAKLSSGKELNKPSDDPYRVSQSLSLTSDLAGMKQYQRNIDDAKGWQDATETALNSMTASMQRARELLVSGSSDTSSQDARNADATEIDQLIEALKQDANTSYRGKQLFSGTATGTLAYATGSDSYQGDAGVIGRTIGPNTSVGINTLGSDILGSGSGAGDGKLLDVLRGIATDLRAGNGAALRNTRIGQLDANLDNLSAARSVNGALTNRLEAAGSRLDEVEENTTKQLNDTEGADMAQTLIDLSTQQAAYQAALKAGANIVQSSLMDFLR